MAIKAVKNFYERIANDENFQNKLNELQDKATEGLELPLTQDKKEDLIKEIVIPFAKEQGFHFSITDIKEFEKSIIKQLDEKQLENIWAGGEVLGISNCIFIGIHFGVWYHREYIGICLFFGAGMGGRSCRTSRFGGLIGPCIVVGDNEKL